MQINRINRMSIIIWFLILICIIRPISMHSIAQEQPDITLLTLYESNMMTLTCVGGTNTYNSALTFLTPLQQKYAKETPKSMYQFHNKTVRKSSYNCNFEDTSECAMLWTKSRHIVKEYDTDYIAPVTDERWENFEIKYTDNNVLKEISYKTEQEYLTISVRCESEVRIHLCDEANVNLQCYVIIIPNKEQQSKTRIESCTSSVENEYQYQPNCEKLQFGQGGALTDGLWGHYTITAELGKQNIKVFKLGQEKPLLEYSEQSRSISKLFISSQAGAFWKIHSYKYLQLHATDQYESIGPPYQARSTGTMCLSLYVAVCSTCKLYIAINDNELRTIHGVIDGPVKWQNVRLVRNILKNQNYSLQIKGTNTNSRTQDFWAIDDIRKCNVKESRKITMKTMNNNNEETVFCQTLNFPAQIVSNNGNIPDNPDTFFCTTSTNIGRNCDIPCESVDPYNDTYCNKNRICKLTETGNETLCACALGYKGTRCNEACTNRKYGYNCQYDCGYCIGGICGKSSGICTDGCEIGYEEPFCTTLVYPMLKTAPTFVNSTLTNITVRLDNIETEGEQSAVKFQIQYTTNTEGQWINYGGQHTLEPLTVITIENLDPEKNYGIRAVLFTNDGKSYQGLRVPNVTAFTNCAGVSENADAITDITFTSTSSSIYIQWKTVCKIQIVFSYICAESWCEIKYRQNYTLDSTEGECRFTGLLPYTLYEIHVSSDRKTFVVQKIKTGASAPPSVRDLTVYSRDEGYLALRWKSPYPPYGELEHYKLTYKKCDSQDVHSVLITEPTPCNIWDKFLCYRITNTEGNQCYEAHIRAKNKNVINFSEYSSLQIYTRQDSSQAPRDLTASWNDQDELILNWTHPFVTNGDLRSFVIHFESTDGNKYNYNDIYIMNDEKKIYTYKIQKSIRLSTKYNLIIYGKNKYVGESTSMRIVTPPATPALMGNITAGERTNTTQVITIPSINKTITDIRDMYVVVCDPKQHNSNISVNPTGCKQNITKQTNCPGTAWIAVILPANDTGTSITVGDNTTTRNKALQPDIDYLVSVVLVNYYNSKCRYKVYTLTTLKPIVKPQEYYSNPALYGLLLLLFLPVIAWFIYRRILKSKRSSSPNDKHNLNLSEFKTYPKEKGTIKESDTTITQPLLQNIAGGQNKVYSRVVQIGNLAVYVKQSMENGELKKQHDLFPKGPTKPWDYGMLTENKHKNRYANISAYDETRVVLDKIQDDPYSDFINANYIDGYQQTKAYIATQGPKVATVNDFWRMIWHKNVNCIVMLANIIENNKKKCEQYWPDNGNTKTYLNIQVSFTSSKVYADYEFRTFLVKCGQDSRQIQQLHFTSWPDHSVPLYPQTLVPFVKKLLTFSTKNQPIVVHCSAGVGRTGTIILCDICLRMAAKEKAIDVVYYLKKIREQRVNMVDNIDQYNLVHMVLLECLTAPDTNISCQNLSARVDQWISQKEIEKQMTYLKNTAWYYRMMAGKITDGNIPANVTKNRFTDIIPETKRIYLTRYPVQDEHSDYINAVPVDGFRFKEQFIATQIPLPHTVGDFWRMVDEQNVGVILSLNEIDINDKPSYSFWPSEHGIINPVPYLNVKYKSVIDDIVYDKYTVQLENKSSKETKNEKYVTIIQFKNWTREQIIPNNVHDLLSLLSETETFFRRNTPVVICCYDGSTACGLFIALSFIIEKIKLEKNVDVCLAVREIRKNRIQFVNDEKQFQFLYEAAVAYVQSFEIYSNFQ